ncbi:MAG: class I SAM-dependent methyltransferase [Solirubrobacterales bacterium]
MAEEAAKTGQDPRERSREAWDRAAPGWSRRREVFSAAGEPVSRKLVELARLEPGQDVLEVACGLGDTGLMAAAAVAPGGRVLVTDSSEAMVEAVRERIEAEAPEGAHVEARQLEAEWLDVSAAQLDAVVSRWGYMLLPDPEAGMREARRVLKPGGRLSIGVWGPREENPWIGLVQEQLERQGVAPPVDDAEPGMFALSRPGALEEAMGAAGFIEPVVEAVPVAWSSASLDERWEEMLETSVSLPAALKALSPAEHYALREAVDEALAPYVAADGSVTLPGLSLVAAAEA